jgi:hypothetical protein
MIAAMAGESQRPSLHTEKALSGVDITLIRWFLSLTPAERLDYLQRHTDAVLAMRALNARD